MAINDQSDVQNNDSTKPAPKADAGKTPATPKKNRGNTVEATPEPSDADKFRAASKEVIDAIAPEVQEEIGPLGRLLAVHNARGTQDPTQLGDMSKAPGRIANDGKLLISSVARSISDWLPFGDTANA